MAHTKPKDTPAEPEKPIEPAPVPISVGAEIKANLALLDRAVSTVEPRFTVRVLRNLTGLRKKLNADHLREAVLTAYPKGTRIQSARVMHSDPILDSPARKALAPYVPSASSARSDADSTPSVKISAEPIPEIDIYLRLLFILHFLDNSDVPKASKLTHETIEKIQSLNRRSLDPLAAKVYFYLDRVHEATGDLSSIRSLLLAAQRTASLRRDEECQVYQATPDKLVSKTTFPSSAGNSQLARYLYYVGRIRAVQLSYTEAHTHLQQAIRRAPVATLAPGFYQTVHKFFIVVELLMGDIPERGLFRHPVLKRALQPYLEIVRAVRTGDLSQFQSTLSTYKDQFTNDGTFTLILRLRHNVIKTGIRSLSIAYSRISLRTIAQKLSLDSEENAEYIVSKAIRDGVIEAKIEHEKGWMESWERGTDRGTGRGGVYETGEPREAFQKRIAFCMELHNESVKAMRYPLNAHRKELASAEAAREREKELAKEIQEGDMDDDGDDATMGDF
ncbi:diphenol oxidase-A2 [Rhizoctonia solani AG-1 IA]|uniref:Diphenol oxidase-A2 n=1 Tax=Thanatephorus cucumeris (strain AG1-IA) TaxID=983506 RepID=L8WU46_THACA|nr:diphenol oxidase-A2 [Rhizoctonia solani AG-1 IA]